MMFLKSNLDDRNRLHIAIKQLNKSLSMIDNTKYYQTNSDTLKAHTFSSSEMNQLRNNLTDTMVALDNIYCQAKGQANSKNIHFVHFPSQSKQFRSLLDNHHDAPIINIETSKPNEIILYLGKKRVAHHQLIDVLNYNKKKFNK